MKEWYEVWPERVGPVGRVKQNLPSEQKLEIFIYRANQVHGKRYDYSLTVFKRTGDKISIICPEHGVFTQTAGSHLSGSGCSKCSVDRTRKTTQQFITEAHVVHQGKYSYDNTVYTRSQDKLQIDCRKHGMFEQRASQHLSGHGCPQCALESRPKVTSQEFIEKATLIHGNRYSYQDTVYTGVMEKLTITCEEHGNFLQIANHHLMGRGCPKCAGWAHNLVYLLDYGNGLYKLGITTDSIKSRLSALRSNFPQGYSAPTVVITKEVDHGARNVEQYLLNKYTNKPKLDQKFAGYTELRILTEAEVKEICSFLETI